MYATRSWIRPSANHLQTKRFADPGNERFEIIACPAAENDLLDYNLFLFYEKIIR